MQMLIAQCNSLKEAAFFWNLEISSQVTIMEFCKAKLLILTLSESTLVAPRNSHRALQEIKDIEDTVSTSPILSDLDKLLKQDVYIQEAETIARYGQVEPLGYDRFYRRYWFFGNSPNRGIFIEQEASRSSQDFSEAVISRAKTCWLGHHGWKGRNVKPKKSFASFSNFSNEIFLGGHLIAHRIRRLNGV
uniref:WHIM2 domain-containing protein n=1 Tax=Ditylenchus dipsaci TaxID=166011 RepID=A0A915CQ15_9BILA